MTSPSPTKPRPAIAINFEPSKTRIFLTLLWAEFSPRAQSLLVYILLQALCIWITFMYHANLGSPPANGLAAGLLDLLAGFCAATGVVHCVFFHGMQGDSSRPFWYRMALPIRHHQLVLPGLLFQLAVAVLLALLWGESRYLRETSDPLGLPLILLPPLAALGQAAMYWQVAAGKIRGTALFLLGLTAGALLAHFIGKLGILDAQFCYALFLTLSGGLSTLLATYALRGNAVSTALESIFSSSPNLGHSPTPKWAPPWSRISARCLPTFPSPFWAQVWFEWRSTALWMPILLGGGFLLVWSLPDDSDTTLGLGFDLLFVPILSGIPVAVAYVYNRVSPQYRSFVLIRPISTQRGGRAKTTAMALALLLTACFSEVPRMILDTLQGHPPTLAGFAEDSILILTCIFLAVYGLMGIAVNLLQGFVQFPFVLLRLAVAGLFDPATSTTTTDITLMKAPIPGAGALAAIITAWMLLRAFGRRFDMNIQSPRELWFPIVTLLIPIVIEIAPFVESIQSRAMIWYIWGTPFITFGALVEYGLRTRLISWHDAATGLAFFLFLFAMGGYTFAYPTETSVHFIDIHFGHWCVALSAPIIWYPLLIQIQRHGYEVVKSPSG